MLIGSRLTKCLVILILLPLIQTNKQTQACLKFEKHSHGGSYELLITIKHKVVREAILL